MYKDNIKLSIITENMEELKIDEKLRFVFIKDIKESRTVLSRVTKNKVQFHESVFKTIDSFLIRIEYDKELYERLLIRDMISFDFSDEDYYLVDIENMTIEIVEDNLIELALNFNKEEMEKGV